MHYQLFDGDEKRSKVSFDPKEPSLGRIRTDSIAPSHTPATIKRCISRVEETPEMVHADLFANISSDAPLKESHISVLRKDAPGLDPDDPMTIVQAPIVLDSPIPDGRYFIVSRAEHSFWYAGFLPMSTVYFWTGTMDEAKSLSVNATGVQVNECSPIFEVFKE